MKTYTMSYLFALNGWMLDLMINILSMNLLLGVSSLNFLHMFTLIRPFK